jgi:hypothetical protein
VEGQGHPLARILKPGKKRLGAEETKASTESPSPRKGYDLSDIDAAQAEALLKVFPKGQTTLRGEDLRRALMHKSSGNTESMTQGMKSALADASEIVQKAPKEASKAGGTGQQKQALEAHTKTAFDPFDQLAATYGKPARASLDLES